MIASRERRFNCKRKLLLPMLVVMFGVVAGFHEMSPLPTSPRDIRESRITRRPSFVSSCRCQDTLTFSATRITKIRPTRCSYMGLCATNGLGDDDECDRELNKSRPSPSPIEEVNSINEFISFLGEDERLCVI